MLRSLLFLSILISFYSCNGTNKTTIISEKITKKKEILKAEVAKNLKTSKIIETNRIVDSEETVVIINKEIQNEKIEEEEEVSVQEIQSEEKINKIVVINKTYNHTLWSNLLQKHVSNLGEVDYKGFIVDKENFEGYLQFLSGNIPKSSWTKNEKLAYWINAYNAFTIKLIIDNYSIKSIKDIRSPWDKSFINIGSKTYSLNDIEHKILRKMGDPRIHFAIVCASVSCPKLQNTAFEAAKIEAQLTNATKEFLADPTRNNLSQKNIKISKIFKWFASDFKQNGSLIDFLNVYSEITISENAKKSFKDYNWNLNE